MSSSHLAMGWCNTATIESAAIISTLLDDCNVASGSSLHSPEILHPRARSGAGIPSAPEYPMVGWEEQLNLQLEMGGVLWLQQS